MTDATKIEFHRTGFMVELREFLAERGVDDANIDLSVSHADDMRDGGGIAEVRISIRGYAA